MTLSRARAFVDGMVRSPVNYWSVIVFDALGAALLVGIGVAGIDGPAVLSGGLVAAGIAAWTLLEYCLHRFIMHGPPSLARTGHAHHHANPTALVSAPFSLVFLVACGLSGVLALLLPPGVAPLFVGGMYAGYNLYGWVHHVEHRCDALVSRVGFLRRHDGLHEVHHARHDVNFGVTTLFWDRVFGTFAASADARRAHARAATAARGPRGRSE